MILVMGIRLNKLVKRIILITLCLFAVSCDRDDISEEKPIKAISYLTNYMDYSHLPNWKNSYEMVSSTNPTNQGLVEIDIDGRNIVRKKGGYGELLLGVYFLYPEIVDEVFYNENNIRIEKKSYSTTIHIHPNLRTIELDNNGLMVKKTNNVVQHVLSNGDTIYNVLTKGYTYNSEKLLIKTHQTQKLLNYSEHSNFPDDIRSYADASYYYTNRNLDSIVTIEHDYIEQEHRYKPKRKRVEAYSNYDNSNNPLKSLFIFEETFKRSLSKNNYGTYKKEEYYFIDETVILTSSYQESHILKYDKQGNIRFDM